MKSTTFKMTARGYSIFLAWVACAPACSSAGHSLGELGSGGRRDDGGPPRGGQSGGPDAGGGRPSGTGGARSITQDGAVGGNGGGDGGNGGDGGRVDVDGAACRPPDDAGVVHGTLAEFLGLDNWQPCALAQGCGIDSLFAPNRCVPWDPLTSPLPWTNQVRSGCGFDVARQSSGGLTDGGAAAFIEYVYSQQTGKLVGVTGQPPADVPYLSACPKVKRFTSGIATPPCAHVVTYDCDHPATSDGGSIPDGGGQH